MDIKTMPLDEVRERFTTTGEDLNRQAAGAIVKDIGEGSILQRPSVRGCLRQDGAKLRMYWADLAKLVRDDDPDLMRLSSTARFSLELACALATGQAVKSLGVGLGSLGAYNAHVVLGALAMPLHIEVTGAETSYR